MKRTSLLILCACFLLLASVPMAMGATCNTAWVSTTAYNGGATVSYNGVNYTAAFWTQGNEPDTNSGPSGSGEPWISNGSCSGGGSTATATATATKTPTATNGCTATAITPYIQVGSGSWQNTNSVTVSSGSSLNLGPQPTSGTWSWTGPNGYSSSARQIAITVSSTSTYTATYTNSCGSTTTMAFTITVTGSATPTATKTATATVTPTATSGCTATAITPYIWTSAGGWQQITSISVSSGTAVDIGPQPVSGGSWSWSGPNGFSSSSREIDSIPLSSGSNSFTATYTNSCGSQSTTTFTVTVSGGATPTATKTATSTPTATSGCTPTSITPYIWTSAGGWQQITSISVSSGTAVDIGPQPVSGGSWSWTGPNGFSSSSREIDSIPLSSGNNTFTATYTNSCGSKSTTTFTVTVSGGGTGACSGVSNITVGSTTYTPAWCQEFTGSAGPPSTTAWNYDLGNNGGWGNGEVEVYCGPPGYAGNPSQCPTTFSTSTAPVYIDGNGHLVIQPRDVGGTWISARMNTEGIQNFQYGILVASIELPDTTNQGLWPAFWTLGSDITTIAWPTCGEADIMENWSPQVDGGAGDTGNNSTIHTALTGGSGIGVRYTFPSGEATNTGLHTYGVIWTANEMQFFVDNPSSPFFTVTPSSLPSGDTWPFNANLFAILNVAVGGTLGGSASGLSNPGPMTVDYVRWYTAQ